MDEHLIESISALWRSGEWRAVVNDFYDNPNHSTLLWVFPSETNLTWLKNIFAEYNIQTVVSIGCGSGLLEWIIEQSIGVAVLGIEVDGAWWGSKYATAFIPLHFAGAILENDLKTREILSDRYSAVLLCYFNNESAFKDYLQFFKGSMVVIIGPGKGRGTHTSPAPFDHELMEPHWKLLTFSEVRRSRDFIAIYVLKEPLSQ